ncbi:helix-turn-helix protein [Flavobacterium lindanitolerans]|uniref:Helix-turn-helix protein n=2 Tax=Flavobacteriia TaxID=117743 RepID=A0A497U009_9FLAO|nr:helix-turn-helix protein [Flavobacterium lindanitolerans]RLJ23980.1 helix-turn-helix protein [Flavobacterium lindanitolerans]
MRFMIHTDMPNKKIHQGRNIKRFREMLGIKQDALAYELGEDWNQKKISLLEQKESVEKDILEQVAKILKVPTEAIENFDEEQAVNIISNTASFDNCQQPAFFNNQPSFNPIDKVVELYDEKIALYERMLKEKDEMMARLEKLIEGK